MTQVTVGENEGIESALRRFKRQVSKSGIFADLKNGFEILLYSCFYFFSAKKKDPHIKKPLNAFMLYMKEMRPVVQSECTLKESAAINQILGRRVSKNINLLISYIYLITYSIFV